MKKRLIIDGHLDLAMNAIEWNRDLSRELDQIRQGEMNMKDKPDRGRGTVCLPELRKGKAGIVFATQLARYSPPESPLPGWNSPQQAWAMTQGQLAWYREMEALGEMRQIKNQSDFEEMHLLWQDDSKADADKPIGYILSLEGADSLAAISYLNNAYGYGVRAIGLSQFGPGRSAPGTRTEGAITPMDFELLQEMGRLNLILDMTHLTEQGFAQAIE